jgi:hypothetical protein
MALKFKDIKDWKPSTISIVDQPSHPMAVFEVYEDDEEFVKKYITPEDKVEVMTKEDNGKNKVQVSEGILEKLINGLVAKFEPREPTEPPAQNNEPVEDENKILEAIGKIDKRLDTMDARITKLEGGEKPPEPPKEDPVPGAVKKSEPPKDDDGGEVKVDTTITAEGAVNPDATVSKSIDPDLAKVNASEKSFLERMGRNSNGMTW